jgi:copper chaperone CopZ
MKKIYVKIDGMSCNHCANKVINALTNIAGISKVKIDLNKKQATIISTKIIEEKILKEVIENLDYKYLGIEDK